MNFVNVTILPHSYSLMLGAKTFLQVFCISHKGKY